MRCGISRGGAGCPPPWRTPRSQDGSVTHEETAYAKASTYDGPTEDPVSTAQIICPSGWNQSHWCEDGGSRIISPLTGRVSRGRICPISDVVCLVCKSTQKLDSNQSRLRQRYRPAAGTILSFRITIASRVVNNGIGKHRMSHCTGGGYRCFLWDTDPQGHGAHRRLSEVRITSERRENIQANLRKLSGCHKISCGDPQPRRRCIVLKSH
jgi:hypothetical protein